MKKHSMMMEMQPEMMAHMMRHIEMPATKGPMECSAALLVPGSA